MTKAEWIDVIKNTMAKVDEQGIYRRPLIERHIQSVYEQMYNELYRESPQKIERYTRKYSETITGETLTSGFALTYIPIDLPRVSGGLFEAYTATADFMLTSWKGYQHSVQSRFDTAGIKGRYLATVLGGELWSQYTPLNPDTLNYHIIPKFTTLSATSEVLIPGGNEDHFIDRIIDTIQHFRPTDLINDNTIQ